MTDQESCAWRLFKYFFVNDKFLKNAIVPTLIGMRKVLSEFVVKIDAKLEQYDR